MSANYQLVITYRLELHLGHVRYVRYVMYHLSLNHCGFDTSMPGLALLFLTSLSQSRCDDVLNLSS